MRTRLFPFFTQSDLKTLSSKQHSSYSFPSPLTMSDKCGNCDCADKSQCVKKGNSLVLMTESYTEFPEVSMVAEHDPKCKCGSTCTCTDCGCGK